MSVTIPSTDAQHTILNGKITNIGTQITNSASNGALVAKLTADKAGAQMDLVLSLLGAGKITASSVLANCTYGS